MAASFKADEMIIKPYLEHHGIQGQRWGIRRFQNPDGTLTEEGKRRYSKHDIASAFSEVHNIDKWGKSPSTNVLYITGNSGSGKSTLALNLSDKNTERIHIDMYTDGCNDETFNEFSNKDFTKLLNKNGVKFRDLSFPFSKEDIKTLDKIADLIEEFGRIKYKEGKNVIAEGVQIMDGTLRENNSFYKEKPVAVTSTDSIKSLSRAAKRDDIKFYDIPTLAVRAKNEIEWGKKLKNFKRSL